MDAYGRGFAGAASIFGSGAASVVNNRSIIDRDVFGRNDWAAKQFDTSMYDDLFGQSTRQAYADQSALALNDNYNGIGSKLSAWYNPQMLDGSGSGLAPSWTQGLPKLRRWDSEEDPNLGSGEIYGNNEEWRRKTMPWLYDMVVPGGSTGGGVGAGGAGWENLNQYDDLFNKAAQEFGVDPKLLKAMARIESGGAGHAPGGVVLTRDDGFGDGLSVGLMQVKPSIWQSLVPDADAYTVEGNIRLGAALMAKSIREQGSWQAALTRVYFPVNDPNGTTQAMYVDMVTKYMGELKTTGGSTGSGGKLGTTDTGYAVLDEYNDEIAAAVQRVYSETGVLIPASLFKAMFFREGGGKGLSRGPSGQFFRTPTNPIYGFNGVSKAAADSYGIDYNRMLTDDAYAIYAMGRTIQAIASGDAGQWGKTGSVVQNYGWSGVAARYFSGNPDPNNDYVDENGETTDGYLNHAEGGVIVNADKWDRMAGGNGLGSGGGGGAGSIESIWGNRPGIGEGQGFGMTEFSQTAQGQFYYKNFDPAVWGYEGGHPGRDYSTPYGTQLYSPVTGTVRTAGGTAFYYNNGRPGVAGEGELSIELDNGDVVVLGHMSRINVQVGQRINANTLVGLSGSENGDHVHVEYRLYDPTWNGNAQHHRLVDPATALQAGYTEGGVVQVQQQQAQNFNDVLQMAMRGDLQKGMPIPYATSSGLRGTEFNQLLHGSIMGAYGATGGFTLTPGGMITSGGGMSSAPGTPGGPPGSNLPGAGTAITQLAQQYVGSPYVHGGTAPTGWDCSGFVYWIYGQKGIAIPQGSHAQLNGGTSVTWAQLQPGDLMFFDLTGNSGGARTEYQEGNYASHVGMYLGNGMMVHAANPDVGTVIAPVNSSYYTDNFLGARRYS